MEKLLNKYGPSSIETALVQLFVQANSISVRNNILIKSILNDRSDEVSAVENLLTDRVKGRNIADFVNTFESLIPTGDKKINGAFFTPKLITDFIVNQTITSPSQKICDPSCGCGAFLIAAASFLCERFNKSIVEVIERNLYGVDIAACSIRRAKILLSLLALQNGEDEQDIEFNLQIADSLVVEWKKLFPGINQTGGFDVVIGNPPYVKFQDLNKQLRKELYRDWDTLRTGNYNLYFAFFELGVLIMKNSGILGYITPNNYFTSLAGIHLREYLTKNKLIEKIVDFNHLKLFKAQTYTCITFLAKKERDLFYYERVNNYGLLDSLNELHYSRIILKYLNNTKWRLLREIDQKNIEKIESVERKLRDIADIRVGIATCKDSVYFVDGSTVNGGYYRKMYQGRSYLIEKEATKPIAKISDFKSQSDLNDNNRRIIFPYRKISEKIRIIKEDELRKLYPRCHEYLLAARKELATRDKGKIKYPEWYAYARTQGLGFLGRKLLTPTFSSQPRFLLEQNHEALFCNGYAIYSHGKRDLLHQQEQQLTLSILQKILNSRVMDYYVKQTSVSIEGGYPCYQKNFIELFGIPYFTPQELDFLKKEEEKQTIDNFLIKKCGINI